MAKARLKSLNAGGVKSGKIRKNNKRKPYNGRRVTNRESWIAAWNTLIKLTK